MVPSDTSSTPGRQERREHPRQKVSIKTELHVEGNPRPFRTKAADLTLGGCFAEMMFTLEVGTKLNVAVWLHDGKLSTPDIVVTRLHNRGNGIKFTKLDPEDRARLKRFLDASVDT